MPYQEALKTDVLQALERIQASIEIWKGIVESTGDSDQTTVRIAMGPFPGLRIPGPPPPFTGCAGEFLIAPPQTGCFHFDIDTYVGQISGLFKGIFHGLEQDESGPANP